jgi:chromosome segregation ATPase
LQQEIAALEKEIAKKRNAGAVAKEGTNYARQLERQAELERELASIDVSTGAAEFKAYSVAVASADAEIAKLTQEIKENEKSISDSEKEITALEKKLKGLELIDEAAVFESLKTALKEAGVAGVDSATDLDELKRAV